MERRGILEFQLCLEKESEHSFVLYFFNSGSRLNN